MTRVRVSFLAQAADTWLPGRAVGVTGLWDRHVPLSPEMHRRLWDIPSANTPLATAGGSVLEYA